MELTTTGRERYDALVAAAPDSIIAFDFDGTLAPIVEDPELAVIHPDAPDALTELAGHVCALAVITGRPARQVLALGGLEDLAMRLAGEQREIYVFGQYGHERWSSRDRRIVSPRPPHGLSGLLRELPGVLRKAGAGEAFVEEKGLAVAVHTRRLPDPDGAFDRLLPMLTELAQRHDLHLEPGRHVIEMRAADMDKGDAVRRLVADLDAQGFCFAGDDLGDIEAFSAVDDLRTEGLATFLICSGSREEQALRERADLVVSGPSGVVAFVRQLSCDIEARREAAAGASLTS